HLPTCPVEARGANHGIPICQGLEIGERSEHAVTVDHERALVSSDRGLDLVSAGLRQLDDTQPPRADSPLRLTTPNRDRAIGTLNLTLDRIGERCETPLAFLDDERPVLECDEACVRSLYVGSVRRDDGVVLALARNAVDSRLRDDAREQRSRRPLDKPTLLG